MKIELQLNSIVVSQGDLESIVGSMSVPSGYLLPAHRKPVKRRSTKKGRMKLGTVIDSLIDDIREEN